MIDTILYHGTKKHLKTHKYSRFNIRHNFSSFNAHTKYEIACIIAENIKNTEYKLIKPLKVSDLEKYIAIGFDVLPLDITHFYMEN